jgi:hypothetical protein
VVINVYDGVILSARRYSHGGIWNYNNRVKSMLVSSGSSPMAYVLSNYKTIACSGQHLFKFDPLTFSTAAWILKTLGSSGYNCGHLGLVFGSTE